MQLKGYTTSLKKTAPFRQMCVYYFDGCTDFETLLPNEFSRILFNHFYSLFESKRSHKT